MSGLELKTKLPEHIFKPQRTELVIPKELTDALTLLVTKAAAKHIPVDTTKPSETREPSEVQAAGSYDLRIERGTLGHIETVTAVARDSGEARYKFTVNRNAQLGIEGIEAVRL